jgi:hypothetical protein
MAHDAIGAHAPRRTRYLRRSQRTSDSGCIGVGSRQLRCRSSDAALSHCRCPAVGSDPPCIWNFIVVSDAPRGLAARAGGAGVTVGAIRVTFWSALAMAVTAGVGALFGTIA